MSKLHRCFPQRGTSRHHQAKRSRRCSPRIFAAMLGAKSTWKTCGSIMVVRIDGTELLGSVDSAGMASIANPEIQTTLFWNVRSNGLRNLNTKALETRLVLAESRTRFLRACESNITNPFCFTQEAGFGPAPYKLMTGFNPTGGQTS